MLGTVNRGGIDTAPIEIVNLGAKGSGTSIEKTIPEKYCDGTKYIIIDVVLISEEDGAIERLDAADGWVKAEILPKKKILKTQFTNDGPFQAWNECLIVARIG